MKTATIIFTILLITTLLAYNFLSNTNQKMEETIDISPSEFKKKSQTEPGVVIDVRTDEEYRNGHLAITNSQYDFLSGEFEKRMDTLDEDKTYYLYCRSGNRSGQAARLMKKNGFENVYNVGGFEELADDGFETE